MMSRENAGFGKRLPTEKQKKFAEEYVRIGDKSPFEAYKLAYPDQSGKYISQDAWRLLRNPKIRELIEEIQQNCRSQFVILAPEALDRLVDLAINAKSEKIRFDANVEILDRAGLKAPDKVELAQVSLFGELGTEDIKNLIKRNLGV